MWDLGFTSLGLPCGHVVLQILALPTPRARSLSINLRRFVLIPMRKVGRKSKPTQSQSAGRRKRRAGRVDSVRRLTRSGGPYDLRTDER